MVDAGLRAAGHRSARYTSPHLLDLTERFVIDGQAVAEDRMIAAVADVRAAVEALLAEGALQAHPTFFEVTTAVAFELFRRARVDIAVIEVGLGGRLDATNVIDPVMTAITSIAFDHQQYLGSDAGRHRRREGRHRQAGHPAGRRRGGFGTVRRHREDRPRARRAARFARRTGSRQARGRTPGRLASARPSAIMAMSRSLLPARTR